MTLVRILKPFGFEQVGEIVDFKGNLEEALKSGSVEVLDADPRPVINSSTPSADYTPEVIEPEIEEEVEVAPKKAEKEVEGDK